MRRLGTGLAAAVLLGALGAASATAPAHADAIGREGCTPGYWKNHTESWEEAVPDTLFAVRYGAGTSGTLDGLTFHQALGLGGGPGVSGAERILARAATAAWLNAANEGLGHPWRRGGTGLDDRPALVPTVRAALASADRATMLALAERLDADNNLGCPLG